MALDQVEVMRALGFQRFAVVGHDRGGRVTWRLAVEHPDVVTKAAILDIVPSPYSRVTRQFATEYFHWFFLIQPAPFPETMIGNSAEYYLSSRFQRQGAAANVFTPEAVAEYVRCFKDPATIHATCEDYRAGATIDLEHAAEDGTRKVVCPLLVLWGERGTVGRLEPVMDSVAREGRERDRDVAARRSLPAGGSSRGDLVGPARVSVVRRQAERRGRRRVGWGLAGNTSRAERTNSRTLFAVSFRCQATQISRRASWSFNGTTATPLVRCVCVYWLAMPR